MEQDRAVASFAREGSFAWMLAAGAVLWASSVLALLVFLLYPRLIAPACEMKARIVVTFAMPIAAGAWLLPLGLSIRSGLVRVALGAIAAVACGAIASWAVSAVFPSFC
jgi:hypothetical protein